MRITQFAQVYKVTEAMAAQGAGHNSQVLATLANVEVTRYGTVPDVVATMAFCKSTLRIDRTLQEGDSGPMPETARLEGYMEGWNQLTPGYWTLKGIVLNPNGAMTFKATKKTKFVKQLGWEEPDKVFAEVSRA